MGKNMKWFSLIVGIIFTFSVISQSTTATSSMSTPDNIPEFTHQKQSDWINSSPLSVDQLIGKVVLIDMWTFDCWNCYRSFPWLNELESKYEMKGLQIIGVHTPEFAHEKIRSNIEAKVKEFKLRHPIMIDNDFSYWKRLNNRYWPSYYLFDQEGQLVYSHVGETHKGDGKAVVLENKVKQLLLSQ